MLSAKELVQRTMSSGFEYTPCVKSPIEIVSR